MADQFIRDAWKVSCWAVGLSSVSTKNTVILPLGLLGPRAFHLYHPNPVQLMGPPQVSLGHELSNSALGQHDDKTYPTWVSIAETLSHAGARECCRDPKTGGKLQANPFRSR